MGYEYSLALEGEPLLRTGHIFRASESHSPPLSLPMLFLSALGMPLSNF